jgi:hypothetical protein
VGLALLFAGFRVARILIPLWGLFAGFAVGGAVASDMSSTPFLGATVGIFVGLCVGLLLAVFAYLYYWAAVLVLAGGIGYWIGSGFLLWLGFSPGILSALVGLGLGIAFAMFALFVDVPRYVLIVLTSMAGAVALVGGALVLFNQMPIEAFSYAVTSQIVASSWWWSLLALALAATGIAAQAVMTAGYGFEKWFGGHYDEPHGGSAPTPHHA